MLLSLAWIHKKAIQLWSDICIFDKGFSAVDFTPMASHFHKQGDLHIIWLTGEVVTVDVQAATIYGA